MKKWLKITLIVVAIIVGLIVLALMALSPVAKSYVNKHGKDLIGREIHVDKLRVNALGGRVRIYDLVVFEDDDTTAFFSFDTLDVSVNLRKLLFHKLHVRHITLAEPHIRVVQNGDRFNFSTIIDHFASDEEPDDDTTSSDWRFGFYNIRLSEGEVYYADRKLKSEWDLKNLNIKVPGVYFDGSENTDAGLTLQLADGGLLRTDASLNLDNNIFNVNLALEHFAISNIKAYLADVMNVGKVDGLLDAAISVNGNLSEILNMNIAGNVALNGIDIADDKGDQVLACNFIAVDVNRINIDQNLYDVKTVVIDQPVSHFDIYKGGNNFASLFSKKESSPGISVEEKAVDAEPEDTALQQVPKPLKLSVGSFQLKDAQFTVNDMSLSEPFSFPIKKINVHSENISTGGENNAKLFAQLPHGGHAVVVWRGNIDEWKSNQHLTLNIRNLQMKDLSPYSVSYLGYPLTDGTFSFTSNNTITNSYLNGNNKLDLFNPEVGDKVREVDAKMNIPLKAALYMLKDKDGKVQFDIPVSGNIDSPEFSYMKIVWKTLGNLLVKVATSPFRAVSKALGLSGELDFIAFDPLQTHFSSEQYSIMNKIAEVLQYDTTIVVTLEPQIYSDVAYKAQSLYLLKEEYYHTVHPEKRNSAILPQVVDYEAVSAITTKDTGFVAYLNRKGLKSKRPSDKEVQRLAERFYPREAAEATLEIVSGYRDDFVKRFFFEQNDINESQLIIAPLVTNTKKSGYSINSQLKDVNSE